MSHEIESAMYANGQPAWHRLGTVINGAVDSTEEAIQLAGLDWEVECRPIFIETPTGLERIKNNYATVRMSDNKVLGVVGKRFLPLQNRDAFKFFNPILHEKDASIDSAGSLRGGKRIWILAKINGLEAEVSKGDPIKMYLLLAHGHDGTLAVSIAFTCIRAVCWNTVRAAIAQGLRDNAKNPDKKTCIQLKHTKNLGEQMHRVQMAMNLASQSFSATLDVYTEMSKISIKSSGERSLRTYVRSVFDVPKDEPKMPRAFEFIEQSFEQGPGANLPGSRGTLWGAYNAVTYFIDHEKGRTEKARLENSWFGAGKALRARAFDEAFALIP